MEMIITGLIGLTAAVIARYLWNCLTERQYPPIRVRTRTDWSSDRWHKNNRS